MHQYVLFKLPVLWYVVYNVVDHSGPAVVRSNTGIVGSTPIRGMRVCECLFYACVFLCVRSRNWKSGKCPKGCIGIEKVYNVIITNRTIYSWPIRIKIKLEELVLVWHATSRCVSLSSTSRKNMCIKGQQCLTEADYLNTNHFQSKLKMFSVMSGTNVSITADSRKRERGRAISW
jgi:hypothetical protein